MISLWGSTPSRCCAPYMSDLFSLSLSLLYIYIASFLYSDVILLLKWSVLCLWSLYSWYVRLYLYAVLKHLFSLVDVCLWQVVKNRMIICDFLLECSSILSLSSSSSLSLSLWPMYDFVVRLNSYLVCWCPIQWSILSLSLSAVGGILCLVNMP